MLTNDLVPCFIQSFSMDSKTGYEKALLVGLFDRTFTCLDRRISASDQAAGPTRRPVAVVVRRDGRLQEVDPWKVVIDDSEERSSRCTRGCGTRRASCASSSGWLRSRPRRMGARSE